MPLLTLKSHTQSIFPPSVLISQLPTLEPHHLFVPRLMFTISFGPRKILWISNISANHRRMSQPVSIFKHTNIPTQNFSLNFPFAHGASSQMSFFQTDTNFCSHPVHPDCSVSTSPAVHQGAILQPQTQVTRSAAFYSLLPPSDSIHNLPSSSLRVTISDAHHIRYTLPDAHGQVSISRYFSDIQSQQISSPTQVGANRSLSSRVRPRDERSDNRHPAMQPSEAKRRKSAGKINSKKLISFKKLCNFVILFLLLSNHFQDALLSFFFTCKTS